MDGQKKVWLQRPGENGSGGTEKTKLKYHVKDEDFILKVIRKSLLDLKWETK